MKVVIATPAGIDPKLRKLIVECLSGILKSIEQNGPKVERQYRAGTLGPSTGYDWYVDQNPKGGAL